MVFTFSQARRVTPEESSPYNNLISNAMKNYTQGIHAKYAPQMAEADIFNKRMTPLSQLAASPMFLALHPEQQQQIANMISQSMPGGNETQTGYPSNGGIMDWISKALNRNGEPETDNPLQEKIAQQARERQMQGNPTIDMNLTGGHQDDSRVPMLPGQGQDTSGAVRANTLAGLNKSPYGHGETFVDPVSGEARTTLTPGNLEKAQSIIAGSKGLSPIVERIKENSAPFLKRGGELGHLSSQASGWLARHGVSKEITDLLGGNKLTNLDAKLKGDITKAVEQAYAAYNLPMNAATTKKLEHIFTPTGSEDSAGFNDRMESELTELVQREGRATKNIGGGINISDGQKRLEARQSEERKRADRVTDEMRASEGTKVELFDPDGGRHMVSPNDVAAVKKHWAEETKRFTKNKR